MSENQSPFILVTGGEDYELLCSEDRASFVLRFKADHMTAHLQGDDAERFKADYETAKQQMPTSQPDQILAQLWDQGGYSWLAVTDGG